MSFGSGGYDATVIFIQVAQHSSGVWKKLHELFTGAFGASCRIFVRSSEGVGSDKTRDCPAAIAGLISQAIPFPGRPSSLVFPPWTGYVSPAMNKTVIEVQVRAVLPTSGGCAVFLGNTDKVFIIYVDQTVGSAITMFMREISKERPLTHDLIAHLMTALGARVERVIINDLKNATYYARMIIRAENELQQKKIVELDGRPSDCIAMATQQKAPIYVSQEVWDEVDDMSDVLRKMEEEGLKPDPEAESAEEE